MTLELPKLTKKGVRISLMVSCVQIRQKNSNRKCPKLSFRNSHTP